MGYILSEVREHPSSANVLLFESMVLLRIVYEYYAFKLLRVQQLLFAIENCVGTQQCNGFVHHIHTSTTIQQPTTYGFHYVRVECNSFFTRLPRCRLLFYLVFYLDNFVFTVLVT